MNQIPQNKQYKRRRTYFQPWFWGDTVHHNGHHGGDTGPYGGPHGGDTVHDGGDTFHHGGDIVHIAGTT